MFLFLNLIVSLCTPNATSMELKKQKYIFCILRIQRTEKKNAGVAFS